VAKRKWRHRNGVISWRKHRKLKKYQWRNAQSEEGKSASGSERKRKIMAKSMRKSRRNGVINNGEKAAMA